MSLPVPLKAPLVLRDGRAKRDFTLELGSLSRCGVAPLRVPVRVGAGG